MTKPTRSMTMLHAGAVGVCLAVSALAGGLIVRPAVVAAAEREAGRAEMERLDAELSDLVDMRGELERRLIDATETGAQSLVLTTVDQLNTRLSDLDDIAARSGVLVEDIGVGAGRSSGDLEVVQIEVVGSGGYPELARFLHRVNGQMRDASVRGFDLTGDPRAADVSGSIALSLAWFAESATSRRNP